MTMLAPDNRTAAAPEPAPHRNRAKASLGDRAAGGFSQGMMILWIILIVGPLLWALMSSFKTSAEIFGSPFSLPSEWSFKNYDTAWNEAGIGQYFLNTVIVVGSALLIVMTMGSMMAYALARFRFPGRFIIHKLVLAGMTFPIFLAVVPLFFTLKNVGLLGTLPGLTLTYVAFALPFTVFFLIPFFESLPEEVAEAAAMDGANEFRTFFSVMLPMAGPGIASVAILNFVGLWNQYLLPVVLMQGAGEDKRLLTQGMATFAARAGYSVDFGAMFAAAILTVLPVLLVYVLFQRQLLASVSQGALK